ncbi:hypothetical protein [Nocardiopsis halotolerans]|uniref:hypothetical protein n=1 Tax=Nocardiopsis halotolerans TaxID=124252 RepID=UPI000344932C|nr:hypothetical protein [Nocardiopsis halotolerans]
MPARRRGTGEHLSDRRATRRGSSCGRKGGARSRGADPAPAIAERDVALPEERGAEQPLADPRGPATR